MRKCEVCMTKNKMFGELLAMAGGSMYVFSKM